MFRFFFGARRLDQVEAKARELAADNRHLRAKISRLELSLISRRADDIVGARDCLIPVPRPGSSAARLLGQNKALRRRAHAAEERAEKLVETALGDMATVAESLEQSGLILVADDVRARADRLAAKVAAPATAAPVASSADLYADHIRGAFGAIMPAKAAGDWAARFRALDPLAVLDVGAVAGAVGSVITALLTGGPVAAVAALRDAAGAVTQDSYALGAEATLYTLALHLGDGWTEDVRTAWCLAIDDIAKAFGFAGNGAPIFLMEESSDIL